MSQTGSTTVQKVTLWQEIVSDVEAAWKDVESFGEAALTDVENFAETEYAAMKTAAVSVIGEFVPKQQALIHGWIADYVKQVKAQGGGFPGIVAAASYCVAMDAAAEGAFLKGELSLGLQAIVGAFLNAL